MSLRTRLRIAIVALVTIVVVAISALYIYDLTGLVFDAASIRADLISNQVKGYLIERIQEQTGARLPQPASKTAYKEVWTDIVRTDPFIHKMLVRTAANAEIVLDIHISGEDGKILAASTPDTAGAPATSARDFNQLLTRNAFSNLWDLEMRSENFMKTIALGVGDEVQPTFRITVVIQSALLHSVLKPAFRKILWLFAISLVSAVFLAYQLPSFVLNPLERLSRHIDMIRAGEVEGQQSNRLETREFAVVQSKLNLLGQQYRGVKQDALTLRSNIEEMLQRLEEAVLLFDGSGRLMMAGHPAERLLGKSRRELLGRTIDQIFPPSTRIGAIVNNALRRREPVHDRVVTLEENGHGKTRVFVNMEPLHSGADQKEMGTLVTLRDAETRRQLQLQLDISNRLAAISRLTGGVAHEIKNPLNAMALHLEVLRSKLDADDPEIEVISKEIKRLDHVVKTFLNFNRPVELQAKPLDLSEVTSEVIQLIEPDARSKGIDVRVHFNAPQWITGDADLLKQAVLNVIVNAVEAMKEGGALEVYTEESGTECLVSISDNGPGIPPEIQDKVFNLYFSTKKTGSGIGLAMTFRVVQLHSGTIDLFSEAGKGTSFRLRFPALHALNDEPVAQGAHT